MYTGFNFEKTELFLVWGIDRVLGDVPVGQIRWCNRAIGRAEISEAG